MNREEVIETIQRIKGKLPTFKVEHIYLFGSVARNESHSGSDLDFLVEFSETVSLFELIHLKNFLEEVFQRKVDVVPRSSLREELKAEILKDAIRAA